MSLLSDRLAKIRKSRGLTQQQVVDKSCGLINTAQVYSNYESGKRSPDYDTLCKLSQIYGVTSDYLLGLSDEELPQMREVTAVTGLSATAVSNISILPQDEKGRLNDMLENWRIFAVMQELNFLYKMINTGKEMVNVLNSSLEAIREDFGEESEQWDRITAAASNRATKSRAEERYARFEVIDALMELVDSMYPLNNYEQITDICHSKEMKLQVDRMEQYARSIGDNGLADFIAGKGEWME